MPGRIVVGVDGSDESLTAVDWAADEAALRGGELRLVNASLWEPHTPAGVRPTRETLTDRARRMLDATKDGVRTRRPSVDTVTVEVEDAPSQALLAAAADADLLVLGSEQVGSGGYLFGSLEQEVVAGARHPVVLVRYGRESGPGGPAAGKDDGRVVIGLDVRHPADRLLDFAFDFAARREVPVQVVHTWHVPVLHRTPADGTGDGAPAELTEALEAAVRPWRERFPRVEVAENTVPGRAGSHLVAAAAGAGLMVVGRRDRRTPVGPHIGSVTHVLVHHALCPVAVVPHD
ncbi:universal stress protein [Streptomyces sp. NPDC002004]